MCIGVYECPCLCLSVCLSLVDVVVSLLFVHVNVCVYHGACWGGWWWWEWSAVGLRVVVLVAVFPVKKTSCV